MASKKKQDSNDGETVLDDKLMKKTKKDKDFKVTEMDEWAMDSDRSEREDSFDEVSKLDSKEKAKGKRKGKKKGKGRKGKGSDDDDDDSEPLEESDEGDFDTREVDYMSDSSSSSEEEVEDKLNRELKGVEDEDALRQLVISDDEEEEEEEGEDNKDKKLINLEKLEPEVDLKTNDIIGKIKIKEEKSDCKYCNIMLITLSLNAFFFHHLYFSCMQQLILILQHLKILMIPTLTILSFRVPCLCNVRAV